MTANNRVDIFKVLNTLCSGDLDYWDKLEEEEQKQLAPLILMRWLSGTSSEAQLMMVNEFVNPYVFPLSKHPKLLFSLMAICAKSKNSKYSWISQKKAEPAKKLSLKALCEYYNYSMREAKQQISLLSKEDILLIVDKLGWEKELLAKVKKEL